MISDTCFHLFESSIYCFLLFFFRNILYRLDERTHQFSVLLEAVEHCKLHQSNETLQAALSKVLSSLNSAQVSFKAGLNVFEAALLGSKWGICLFHVYTHTYTQGRALFTFCKGKLWAGPEIVCGWNLSFLFFFFFFWLFKRVPVSRHHFVQLDKSEAAFCTVDNLSCTSISEWYMEES